MLTEAAKRSHWSYTGLMNLIDRGIVECIKVNGRNHVNYDDVVAYINAVALKITKTQLIVTWLDNDPEKMYLPAREIKRRLAERGITVSIDLVWRVRSKYTAYKSARYTKEAIERYKQIINQDKYLCLGVYDIQRELELQGITLHYSTIKKLRDR